MAELLRLEGLSAGYGAAVILPPTDLVLDEERSLAILGRNGVGKTTLLNSLIGVTDHHGGRILFRGQDITQLPPDERAAKGHRLGSTGAQYIPFADCDRKSDSRGASRAMEFCPHFRNVSSPGRAQRQSWPSAIRWRAANACYWTGARSQSENSIARRTDGRARADYRRTVTGSAARLLRDEGIAAIIIEQHARKILALTDDAIILERGRIVHQSESATLLTQPDILDQYLGIGSQSINL